MKRSRARVACKSEVDGVMVSPYLNRPLRSLEEVLRARGVASATLVQETHASDPVSSQDLAGDRKGPDSVPLTDPGAGLTTRREAA